MFRGRSSVRGYTYGTVRVLLLWYTGLGDRGYTPLPPRASVWPRESMPLMYCISYPGNRCSQTMALRPNALLFFYLIACCCSGRTSYHKDYHLRKRIEDRHHRPNGQAEKNPTQRQIQHGIVTFLLSFRIPRVIEDTRDGN